MHNTVIRLGNFKVKILHKIKAIVSEKKIQYPPTGWRKQLDIDDNN